jgi:hypothetical protein
VIDPSNEAIPAANADLMPISPSDSSAVPIADEASAALTERILAFLAEIGIPSRPTELARPTFLPGVTIDRGTLLYDLERLRHPGDLLHEAGHIAVASPEARAAMGGNLDADPGEEMMSTAWTYAAAVHMGVDPALVFDPDGYAGYGDGLAENFRAGRYIAVPLLQWIGLTLDEDRARELGAAPYPAMLRWLRE